MMRKIHVFAGLFLISVIGMTLLTGCKGSAYYARKHAGEQGQAETGDQVQEASQADEAKEPEPAEAAEEKQDTSSSPEEPRLKEPGRASADRNSSSRKSRIKTQEESSSVKEEKENTWVTDEKENLGKYDDNPWTGFFLADDNRSIYISEQDKDSLKADYISYSEDGWTEGSAKIKLAADDEKKAYMDMEYAVFELLLDGDRIVIDAPEDDGSFMEGKYYRSEGKPDGVFMMERSGNTPADYYAAATFKTADEVEAFAVKLRLNLLYSNTDWIMNNVSFPFVLSGEIIEDEDTLYEALSSEDSILYNYKFLDSVRECNCSRMPVSSDGIAMGDGYVWFRETVDGDLSIIALNSP